MNTTENNKLIAEFLGYSQPHPDYPDTTYWYKKEQPPLTILSFDTDWNWLMQVVEKIEETADWSLELLTTDKKRYQMLIHLSNTNIISENKIKAVYNACVEFIKWYNEQPK